MMKDPIFGADFGAEIYSYTREQAIKDGVLVDVTETAKEAGFQVPVALTRAVWVDCVEWPAALNKTRGYQDETGRLWDVLWMAYMAISRVRRGGEQLRYSLLRLERTGTAQAPREVALKLHSGPGDNGEHVITIMEPEED